MLRLSSLLVLLVTAHAASAITASVSTMAETCGNVNGKAWSYVSGGQWPFTYAWTGPNGYTGNTDSIFALDAGEYILTVTDYLGAVAQATGWVDDMSQLPPGMGPTWAGASSVTGYWGGACEGQCNGAGAFVEFMGYNEGPYSYTFSVPAQYLGLNTMGDPVYEGFCFGESVSYSYSNALGCSGNGSFTVYGIDQSWNAEVSNLQGACGTIGGSVDVMPLGAFSAVHTLYLNGQFVATEMASPGWAYSFTDLLAGDYTLDVTFNDTQCSMMQSFTIPDLGAGCASISGTSWYDLDVDCVQDMGEVGIPYSLLAVEPGGYYAITHGDGSYSLTLPAGNYTLDQTDPTLVPNCPATLPAPFTISSTPVVQDLASGSTEVLDLSVDMSDGFARPGFDYGLHAYVSNPTPQVSGPVTVTCTFDAALTYLSATPVPTSVSGNTITWDLPAYGSFGSTVCHVVFNVPVGTPLGTVLYNNFSVSNTLTESTLANNTDEVQRTVTGSYDPNVKEVRTSSGESNTQYIIGTDEWLQYTIHFQNTGTDTAFTVVVTDTLPAGLDLSTFEQGATSHPFTVDFLADRLVRWTFTDILLPDSTTNEALSHGLTSFRIRLVPPVVPNMVITNNADIFFDFNPPIRTPEAVVVTEMTTDISTTTTADALRIVPNPAHDRITVLGTYQAARIRILAMDGRIVLEQPLMSGNASVDISALAAGSYLVEVADDDGRVGAQRLVKR
ncbi:MAG: T9SS type A sorting domain-containing protein [Flavobacteriales bacterium]|nr:T9SS type A sorting domain-containing protein [Flavobacteriales bacterium]